MTNGLLYRILSAYNADQKQDDRSYEEHINEASKRVGRYYSKQPQDQQYYRDSFKHCFSSSMSIPDLYYHWIIPVVVRERFNGPYVKYS